MQTTIKVKIRNDHPHAGCVGTILLSPKGLIPLKKIYGVKMVRVVFEDCKHMTQACYAEPDQLIAISPPTEDCGKAESCHECRKAPAEAWKDCACDKGESC